MRRARSDIARRGILVEPEGIPPESQHAEGSGEMADPHIELRYAARIQEVYSGNDVFDGWMGIAVEADEGVGDHRFALAHIAADEAGWGKSEDSTNIIRP